MNKIIAIAAAMVAGVSMAQGIESANIVGYATGATRSGFKAMGAQFVSTTGGAVDLTDVVVKGYDPEAGTEAEVKVQTLDSLGRGGMTYSYYDVPGELTGWLDSFDEPIGTGDVLLSPGEGLWVSAPSTSFSLQTSGQVLTSDVSVTLRAGFKLIVNSTPVNVDLTSVDVSGYDAEAGTEAEVKVQSLDSLGRGGMTYSFYDVPGELLGWLDSFDEPVATSSVLIAPGEGLWASSPSTAFSVILPGVTL